MDSKKSARIASQESIVSRRLTTMARSGLAAFALALAAGSAAGPLPASFGAAATGVTSAASPLGGAAQAQIDRLQQIKAGRSAIERKIDSQLFMAALAARGDARVAGLGRFHFLPAEADGRWPVDVVVADGGNPRRVLEQLQAAAAEVITPKREIYRSGLVRARLGTLDTLAELAASADVKLIRQALPTVRSALADAPVADVRGLRAHAIDQVRATYGARGAGTKVCVISDGIDALGALQAQRAMPRVDVLPGRAGRGNEGLAMLSVVHEVAPAAALGFASAGAGQADYIQALQGLAARGCQVIVDDLLSLDESPFEDSPAAQAVEDVSAKGVLVVSAAGNDGNVAGGRAATWEGDFRSGASGVFHDFGDGAESIRVSEAAPDATAVLIWAEHYALTRGEAATDYDLYELDASGEQVLNASLNAQDGRGGDDFPVESLRGVGKGSRLVVMRTGVARPGAASPMFNLLLSKGQLDPALATAGAIRGHGAAASALSIGAVSAAAAISRASRVEPTSSEGPRRLLLDRNGDELTPGNRSGSGGVVRQKPDMVAADQVGTAVPGYARFSGTSASAAHAAGIAALLRGANPSLGTSALRAALGRSAVDIESTGADAASGAGVVMPMAALQAAAAASQSVLVARLPALIEFAGDGDSAIEPNEIWSLQLPLSNTGSATAARISATFTANTPNVTVLNGSSAYPDIAAGASAANSTNFQFRVEPGYPCGLPLSFSVVVTSDSAASPQTFPVAQPTGGEGTPVVVSYGGPVVAIPDGSLTGPGPLATASVTLAGVSAIRDVNFSLDGSACTTDVGATTVGIDHSYVADLELSLRSPTGVVVPLITAVGGSGNNFCQTLLDDESSGSSIQDADFTMAPFTDTYTPASPLSAFDGANGNGSWTLQAQDDAAADTGNLRSFTLTVTPAVCNAPPLPRGPFVQSIVRAAPSPTRAASVSYTVQFSEAVTGVDASDFVLSTTGAVSGAAISSVSGSGSVYTVGVSTGSGAGSGTLRLDLVDNDSIRNASAVPLGTTGLGNGNYSSGEVYAIDRTGPGVSLAASTGQGDPATASPVRFDVQFDEATTQFAADDVVLGGTSGPTTATISGSGSSYVVSVSGMSANGTLNVGIRAAAITDAAGNASTASNTVSIGYSGLTPDVGFTLAAQSLSEGSGAGSTVATVTATLSRSSTLPVTVPVLVDSASTATGGGTDYSLSASQLVFPAGATTASLNVTITRDSIQEPDETIVLKLGTPSNATVGAPATQTITIVNDDDTTPDAFAFTPVTGVALLSPQTSTAVTVAGINQPAAISITGGSYRINGGAATSSAGTVVAGDSVSVSLTASALFSTPATATLSIGGVSGSFTATTRAALTLPDPFAFLPVTDAALSALVVSNPVTVTGIEIGVPITVSGGEYSLNGGAYTAAPGTTNPNDVVRVRQTASPLAATTTTAVLSIGSGSTTRVSNFAVTTANASSPGGGTGGGTTGGGTTGGGTGGGTTGGGTGGGSTGGSTGGGTGGGSTGGTTGGGTTGSTTGGSTGTTTGGVLPEGGGGVPVGGSGGGGGGGAAGPGLLLGLLAAAWRRRRALLRG